MGVTDTKTITKHIDQQYKSIRKYHDPIYGEITMLEQKDTKKMYALVEKVMVDQSQVTKIRSILQNKKQYPQFLVQLHHYYSCKIDYCSNLEKHYLLLQFHSHTLYNQMALRLENNDPFRLQELLNIFNSYIQILTFLKQQGQRFNHIPSNHRIIYQPNTGGLKTVLQIMKCDEQQRFANDHFHNNSKSHCQEYFVYHSPQVFALYCNKQIFYAKTLSRQQSSVIFTLAMNFLECALLADLSGVYDFKERKINFDKLNIVLHKLRQVYGSQISEIIAQMLNQNPSDRPTILQLNNINKSFPKRRKITIPKHTKVQHLKLKQQLHAN